MRRSNFVFKSILTLLATLLWLSGAVAQTAEKKPAEPSYELTLQVFAPAKNAGEKSPLAPTFSGVVRTLKNIYPNTNYELAATFFQRVANTGNLEFKGIASAANQNQEASNPVFSEWTIADVSNAPDTRGANIIQLVGFRFGQRIPVRTGTSENGKPLVTYESVGVTMRRLNLSENTPTVIGNFSGAASNEQMFLVMTVKPVQN